MRPPQKATEKDKQRMREYVKAISLARQRIIRHMEELFPCEDCGGYFHHAAMEWDHCRGEKKFDLTSALTWSWKTMLEELDKCDLVCANCHSIRTFNRRVVAGN